MTYLERDLRLGGVSETVLALRRWRRAMRLTQTEVAVLVGVHPRTLQACECGKRSPRARTFDVWRALAEGWDESRRPARGPERRGTYRRTARHRSRRFRSPWLPWEKGSDS